MGHSVFTRRCGCGSIVGLRESCAVCTERKRVEVVAKLGHAKPMASGMMGHDEVLQSKPGVIDLVTLQQLRAREVEYRKKAGIPLEVGKPELRHVTGSHDDSGNFTEYTWAGDRWVRKEPAWTPKAGDTIGYDLHHDGKVEAFHVLEAMGSIIRAERADGEVWLLAKDRVIDKWEQRASEFTAEKRREARPTCVDASWLGAGEGYLFCFDNGEQILATPPEVYEAYRGNGAPSLTEVGDILRGMHRTVGQAVERLTTMEHAPERPITVDVKLAFHDKELPPREHMGLPGVYVNVSRKDVK